MKKIFYSLIAGVIGVFSLLMPLTADVPVYADECYDGAILDVCDDGKGSGITEVLKIVVRVLTIGVGIFAVIGISVAGVQYLTAGASEEQTRKAKRRIIEIIIGVVAFVLLYALLSWLLPDFSPDKIWS